MSCVGVPWVGLGYVVYIYAEAFCEPPFDPIRIN